MQTHRGTCKYYLAAVAVREKNCLPRCFGFPYAAYCNSGVFEDTCFDLVVANHEREFNN